MFISSITAITVAVSLNPSFPLWDFAISAFPSPDYSPIGPLTSSAALLALLLFAANRARDMAQSASSGTKYLGQNLETFHAKKSPFFRLLSEKAFQTAVLLLFAIPLALPLFPSEFVFKEFLYLPDWETQPQLVLTALWCACYGTVAGVLLVNVVQAIRYTAGRILFLTWVKRVVEYDMAVDTHEEYLNFFTLKSDSPEEQSRGFVSKQLATLKSLSEQEQRDYFEYAISPSSYASLIRRKLDQADRYSKSKIPTKPQGPSKLSAFTHSAATWWHDRRVAQASDLIVILSSIQLGRLEAFLTHLEKHESSNNVRTLIISQIRLDARIMEKLANTVRSADGAVFRNAEWRVILPAAEIANPDGGQAYTWHGKDSGPQLEIYAATAYRRLSWILFSKKQNIDATQISPVEIQQIIENAAVLSHEETREDSLQHLLNAIITKTISEREDRELIPESFLKDLLSSRPRFSAPPHYNERTTQRSVSEVVETCAFNAAIERPRMDPSIRANLLGLVTGWRLIALVLHELFYAVGSHDALTSTQLAPFYMRLRKYRWNSKGIEEKDKTNVLRFLQNSQVSHLVGNQGAEWILGTAGKPLTLNLLADFITKNEQRVFVGFSLLPFVQWHLCVSEINLGYLGPEDLEEPKLNAITRAKPALMQLAEDWETTDSSVSSDLRQLLRGVPDPDPDPWINHGLHV